MLVVPVKKTEKEMSTKSTCRRWTRQGLLHRSGLIGTRVYALRFNGPKTHLRYDEILDIVLLGTRKDDFICAPVSIVGFKSCTKGARECLRPRVGVMRHT